MWHSLILQDYFECALVTHRFALNDIMKAYDVFGNAAKSLPGWSLPEDTSFSSIGVVLGWVFSKCRSR